MQVSFFNSLTFKLFWVIAVCVLLTTGFISYSNYEKYSSTLQGQLESSIRQDAINKSRRLNQVLGVWKSQGVQMNRFFSLEGNKTKQKNFAKDLLDSQPSFISLHMVRIGAPKIDKKTGKNAGKNQRTAGKPKPPAPSGKVVSTEIFAFTQLTESKDFSGINPDQLKITLQGIGNNWATQLKNITGNRLNFPALSNPSLKLNKLPIIQMAVPVKAGQDIYWVIISAWQKALTSSLRTESDTHWFFSDFSGRIIASPSVQQTLYGGSKNDQKLARLAAASKLITGKPITYRNTKGEERIASFSKLDEFRAAVTVIKNPTLARETIRAQIFQSLSVSGFVVLFAFAFSYFISKGTTRNLRYLTEATQVIASGRFDLKPPVQSSDEVGLLSHSVGRMGSQLNELFLANREAARKETELQTAKTVQETFFPTELLKKKPLSIIGLYEPASECGGDWWGHFSTASNREYICIADATGHGAGAALVTAMAYAACMMLSHAASEEELAPGTILKRLNDIMYKAGKGKTTMTFFVGYYDFDQGIFRFSNAGHNPPYLIPKDPEDKRFRARQRKKGVIPIQGRGAPLGIQPGLDFEEDELGIKPLDKFFFFTDGLIECTNPEKQMWGKKKLIDNLKLVKDQDITAIKTDIVDTAFKFFDGEPPEDDVTVVVAELDEDWNTESPTILPEAG